MTVKDAVAKRFEQLCDQLGICPNKLATRPGAYSKIDLLFIYFYSTNCTSCEHKKRVLY
jgi:hypothetical protein